jgi:hypothetical protein
MSVTWTAAEQEDPSPEARGPSILTYTVGSCPTGKQLGFLRNFQQVKCQLNSPQRLAQNSRLSSF